MLAKMGVCFHMTSSTWLSLPLKLFLTDLVPDQKKRWWLPLTFDDDDDLKVLLV